MYMYITKFNLEKLRQAVPIFIKIMEWDTTERYNVCKKMFKRKLISVLFEILKDKDDYLDVAMIIK